MAACLGTCVRLQAVRVLQQLCSSLMWSPKRMPSRSLLGSRCFRRKSCRTCLPLKSRIGLLFKFQNRQSCIPLLRQ